MDSPVQTPHTAEPLEPALPERDPSCAQPRSLPLRALYTATIFLGSALLFLVQPMVAKMILPVFGGSPGVWNAAMLFFQLMLLLGYAYAHASVSWLGPKRQSLLHVVVLCLALLVLPFGLRAGYEPGETAQASLQVVFLLASMVGLPFFVVSAQAPLLQRWFASTRDPRAKDPYFLYSASNVGSMIALAAYPLLLEPRLRLAGQSSIWTLGYAALALFTAASAATLWFSRGQATVTDPVLAGPAPSWRTRARWVLLAAVPSSLLLGVTSFFTSNIAPIPLLWVVPLALYLLTFILAFRSRPVASGASLARWASLFAVAVAIAMLTDLTEPLLPLAVVHLGGFFVVALACHTLVSESRPGAGRLTEFYLWIALGGVLGGAFNALIAPSVFNSLLEYGLALAAALALFPARNALSKRFSLKDFAFVVGVGVLVAALIAASGPAYRAVANAGGEAAGSAVLLGMLVLCVVVAFAAYDRPYRYGAAMAVVLCTAPLIRLAGLDVMHRERSFFGAYRVTAYSQGTMRMFVHGNTEHGRQNMRKPNLPLLYYHPTGPIGDVFQGLPVRKNVAVVGLGIGAMATYGKPGMSMTFYEIDPVVERIARDERLFTHMADSEAALKVVIGDARLRIRDAEEGEYDLIVLDAFSSDAIPVHLLTAEAIQLYLEKLHDDGVLVFHISNRYLRLRSILAKQAEAAGLRGLFRFDLPNKEQYDEGKVDSQWFLMAREWEDLEPLASSIRWAKQKAEPETPLWTDDFSNLLSAFKKPEVGP